MPTRDDVPSEMPRLTVKLSANRQVVIPKRLCEEIPLETGDLLDVTIEEGRVVFTPQALVDRRVIDRVRAERRLPAALRAVLRR